MQYNLSKLKRSYKRLIFQQKKLEENINAMGNEINKLEKQMNSEKSNSIPTQTSFDVNEELDRFLSNAKIQNDLKNVKKAYLHQRLKAYVPLGTYLLVVFLSISIIYSTNWFKINKPFSLMLILIISFLLVDLWYKRLHIKVNKELSNSTRKLNKSIQIILKQGSFNAEYLKFILTQRIKERKSLDLQFSTMIKLINGALNFTAVFGIILWLVFSFFHSREDNVLIPYVVAAIITVIVLGIAIDLWNYKFSDAYYCSYEILLEAMVKYKIEEKSPRKLRLKLFKITGDSL